MSSPYIKSPLNYIGGKYKLLPQILPLFPKNIDTFVDVFCGGLNVAINVTAEKYICNDKEPHIIDLYEHFQSMTGEEVHEQLLTLVAKYALSKTNAEGFIQCRTDYNSNPTWNQFYILVAHAFNYQIRFNQQGKYNMPFGNNRSSYNPNMQKNLIAFVNALTDAYRFTNLDFRNLDLSRLTTRSLVYCDPPYTFSTAPYNESNGWTEQDDIDLCALLDQLNDNGIHFAMSNVLTHKGVSNIKLIEWANKYTIHHLNYTYSNCNYHAKDTQKLESDEVLIVNF